MWNFIKTVGIPGFFIVFSINGLISRPSDERWIFFIGLLIGLGGAWGVWRQMTGAADTGNSRPLQSYMACEMCGYHPPQHPLTRCHYCQNPSAHIAPNCICEKCELDRYYAYGGE